MVYTLIGAQCNIAVVILLLYQSMTCGHTAITFSYFIAYTLLDMNVREVVDVQYFLHHRFGSAFSSTYYRV